jgi:hypothetical protein
MGNQRRCSFVLGSTVLSLQLIRPLQLVVDLRSKSFRHATSASVSTPSGEVPSTMTSAPQGPVPFARRAPVPAGPRSAPLPRPLRDTRHCWIRRGQRLRQCHSRQAPARFSPQQESQPIGNTLALPVVLDRPFTPRGEASIGSIRAAPGRTPQWYTCGTRTVGSFLGRESAGQKMLVFGSLIGAARGIRTPDPIITNYKHLFNPSP